jgi:hypothetical protein
MKRYILFFLFAAILSACDSDGGFVAPKAPPNQLIGGIWDSGRFVIVADEFGEILWYDPALLTVGSGNATVIDTAVTGGFTLYSTVVPDPLPAGYDGRIATCSLAGTLAQRDTLSISVVCTRPDGTEFLTVDGAEMTYAPVYERDSSLGTIEGMYQVGPDVMEVAADGMVFLQEAATACVTTGQVAVLDPSYNLYDVSLTINNCVGAFIPRNGALFTGFIVLDDEENPGTDTMHLLAIGDRTGIGFGLYFEGDRL